MRRLIDADKLFDAMEETEWYNNADRDEIAERLIMDAPTIDIVRCSECKHWRTYETWSECERWTDDPYESAKTKADDFCSYGERRGGEMNESS